MAGKQSFWARLLGRKQRPKPTTPEEQLRAAVAELGQRHERKVKKGWRERTHTDDRRELVINKDHSAEMPDALADLTAQAYLGRKYTETDEPNRVTLRRTSGQADAEAAEATGELEAGMTDKDREAAEHYYSATERMETGEVDRTYEIEKARTRRAEESKRRRGGSDKA